VVVSVYNDNDFVVLMSTMAVMELMVTVQVRDGSVQPFSSSNILLASLL